MQLILHENVPMVVAYQNIFIQAYRNDLFTGHIQDVTRGIEGTWTLRKIHRIDEVLGGTVPIAIDAAPDNFNLFNESNTFASSILSELWPSLYLLDPLRSPHPYLAKEMLTETHSDNPSVPKDRTRFTIDIIRNATWNDGTPVTAEDVVYTFKYLYESGAKSNPGVAELTNLVSVYAPSTYRVIFEFETESYWHFSKFAYTYIIPKLIFDNVVGYEGWDSWDSLFYNDTINVGAGPFKYTPDDVIPDDSYILSVNPDFCYYPEVRLLAQEYFLNSNSIIQFSEIGVVSIFLVGFTYMKKRESI